ncbi:hypothetical protein GS436_14200 [Rhodococcus hoagii]|nr:hypothetical protein [Prescottella equi]
MREESDTDEDRLRFLDSFGLEAVTVYHSGYFGVDLSDDRGLFEQAFMDATGRRCTSVRTGPRSP